MGTLCPFVFCAMHYTCPAHPTLVDFYHPNSVGQRLQLLKFLTMEFLSRHVTSFYAQIFYAQSCQARWLLLILGAYLEGTLFESLLGRLAIMTDNLDMSVFGLVGPEEVGTKYVIMSGTTLARTHARARTHTHTHTHTRQSISSQKNWIFKCLVFSQIPRKTPHVCTTHTQPPA